MGNPLYYKMNSEQAAAYERARKSLAEVARNYPAEKEPVKPSKKCENLTFEKSPE